MVGSRKKWAVSALLLALSSAVSAAENPPAAAETPAQRQVRMQWWRDAKFGLFIHWGGFSQLAGLWQGKRCDTPGTGALGEWIMKDQRIPVADYARELQNFNPAQFDADAWASLAREAGVRYIVITAKHHEGFAMFHSQASAFNIVDHTAFKRDPMKELSVACQKQGIRLGFYYSQAQDWHHAGGAAYGDHWVGGDPATGHWDAAQNGDFDSYLEKIAIPQVRELLSNYGPVAVLWWDTPVGMSPERAARLAPLTALQPGIITNNRLLDPEKSNAFSGDTETPEQTIPPTGFVDRDFEACMTMNDTWGYKRFDQHWKPYSDLLCKLVDIASKGGNFLLNVGPDELGRIPEPSVERLQAMGRWIDVNKESLYGTSASPFAKLPWGRATQRKHPGAATELYLHVFNWPKDSKLLVPGLKSPVASARLLAGGTALKTASLGHDTLIYLPPEAPDPVISVVRLELTAPVDIDNRLPSPAADGTVSLPLWMADIHNEGYGTQAYLGQEGEAPAIQDWKSPRTRLIWTLTIPEPGTYEVLASLGAVKAGAKLQAAIGKESQATTLAAGNQEAVSLGQLKVLRGGVQELRLTPVSQNWQPLILRSLTLRPVVTGR